MGRKSVTGGVCAKGADRIEFTFYYQGKRYRPSLVRIPTEANLERARKHLKQIKERIKAGTFSFTEEFPDYRYQDNLEEVRCEKARQLEETQQLEKARQAQASAERTCNRIFDAFIAHCEMRVAMNDMAFSTFNGYQKILDSVWRPRIGKEIFEEVIYSQLQKVAAEHAGITGNPARLPASGTTREPERQQKKKTKKTYNNVVSVVRCAFDFGYKDHPEKHNPASGLTAFRITKKDRAEIDPFTIQEGETIIATSHAEFGLAHGNYEEFRFFTALRQSEQIALTVDDCDVAKGKIRITHARVLGREKDRTKTREDREITLCPRALQVLKRQLTLRAQLQQEGKIDHAFVFFRQDGAPIINLSYPYDRWRYVLERTQTRYREPYNARHSYISWCLMIGKNILLVAKEDGHSVHTMLTTYARWTEGATESDIETIRRAMECSPTPPPSVESASPGVHAESAGSAPNVPPGRAWGRLSWRKHKHFAKLMAERTGLEPGHPDWPPVQSDSKLGRSPPTRTRSA
jgi:integrase